MADIIRVGRVSSIDYVKGMISVFYEDKTAAVTAIMPTLANGEYRMPGIGEMVVVAHLSNGTSEGIVLGTIWNDIQVQSLYLNLQNRYCLQAYSNLFQLLTFRQKLLTVHLFSSTNQYFSENHQSV